MLLPSIPLEFQEAWAYNALGDKYYSRNQKELAFASYLKALEIDPGYLEAHFNIAKFILEECKNEKFEDTVKINKAIFHLKRLYGNSSQYNSGNRSSGVYRGAYCL